MNDLERIIEDCYKSDLVSDKIIKKIIETIGQKEWQNLHDENNDICTTMGELIITLDRIAELEKENTELKGLKDVATLIRANNDTVTTLMQLNNMLVSRNQQLTNAKELLKEFVHHYKAKTIYIENMKDLLEQAEQFLKESE